jgi:hypothetical protein
MAFRTVGKEDNTVVMYGTAEWFEITRRNLRGSLKQIGWKTSLCDADVDALARRLMETRRNVGSLRDIKGVADSMLLNLEFVSVTEAIRQAQTDYDVSSDAAQRMIVQAGFKSNVDLADKDAVFAVIMDLGDYKKALPLSAAGRQRRDEEDRRAKEQAERARIIQNITGGKSHFMLPQASQKRLWNVDYGKPKSVPSSSLEGESLDALRVIAAEVAAYRVARDGQAPAPVEQADTTIEATVPAPKIPVEAQVTATDEFLAHPDFPDREYTKRELMSMDRAGYSRLLFSNGQSRGAARRNAISRILSGKPFGA